jgi:hypothetical protein
MSSTLQFTCSEHECVCAHMGYLVRVVQVEVVSRVLHPHHAHGAVGEVRASVLRAAVRVAPEPKQLQGPVCQQHERGTGDIAEEFSHLRVCCGVV